MKKPKVSIIIPVYNAERSIERCIKGCMEQSYKNIEIIVIDDKSRDKSLEKIYAFADKDCRIRCVSKEHNAGVSAARNTALSIARGEYVVFIDSDDFLCVRSIEKMVELALAQNADMVVGSWRKIRHGYNAGKVLYKDMKIGKKGFGETFLVLDRCLSTVWGKMYKLEIMKSRGITFNEQMSIGEDHLFNLQYLLYCNWVLVSRHILYNYSLGGKLSTVKYHENYNTSYAALLLGYRSIAAEYEMNIALTAYAMRFFKGCTIHYIIHSDECNSTEKVVESYRIFEPAISQCNYEALRNGGYGKKEISALENGMFRQYMLVFKQKHLFEILKRRILKFLRKIFC